MPNCRHPEVNRPASEHRSQADFIPSLTMADRRSGAAFVGAVRQISMPFIGGAQDFLQKNRCLADSLRASRRGATSGRALYHNYLGICHNAWFLKPPLSNE